LLKSQGDKAGVLKKSPYFRGDPSACASGRQGEGRPLATLGATKKERCSGQHTECLGVRLKREMPRYRLKGESYVESLTNIKIINIKKATACLYMFIIILSK
jgi:hypothetical protein